MSEKMAMRIGMRELLIHGPRIDALRALSDQAVARGDRKITIEYEDIPVLYRHGADCPEAPKRQEVEENATYILELQLWGRTFIYCSMLPFRVPFPMTRLG